MFQLLNDWPKCLNHNIHIQQIASILQESFNQLTKLIHSMWLLSGSIHFFFSRYTRCVCVLVAMNQTFSWWNRYALELWLKTVIETIYTYVGQFINQIALILNELRVDVRTFWMPVYTVYSVVCIHCSFWIKLQIIYKMWIWIHAQT